jgi:hypothetical protein
MRKSLAYVSLAVMSAFAALSPAHSDGRFWLKESLLRSLPLSGIQTANRF